MISIVLLLPFFNNFYCMHCMYNVVVIIVVYYYANVCSFNARKCVLLPDQSA